MSLTLTLKIEGLDKFRKVLQAKEDRTFDIQKQTIEEGAQKILNYARSIIPVEFGFARANLNTEMIIAGQEISAKIGVNDIVTYAEDLENMYKTNKRPRKAGKRSPFLKPSLMRYRSVIKRLMIARLKKEFS